MKFKTIEEALKELNENDSSKQRYLNRRFKKKFVNLKPGATIHHLDDSRRDEMGRKITDSTNVIIINENVLDANFINQLIHFCKRRDINMDNLLNEIYKMEIYKPINDSDLEAITIDDAIKLSK